MSFISEDCKYCICCSMHTIESLRFDPEKNSGDYQVSVEGLTCSRCNCMVCKDCVEEINTKVEPEKKMHLYHEDTHSFLKGIAAYASKGTVPTAFVGHCCLIDQHYDRSQRNYQEIKAKINYIRSKKQKHNHDDPHLGGCFLLPKYQLLIPTTEAAMDVFSYGADIDTEAVLHCVLDELYAQKMVDQGGIPSTAIPNDWDTIVLTIPLLQPHNISKSKNKKKVRIILSLFHCIYIYINKKH